MAKEIKRKNSRKYFIIPAIVLLLSVSTVYLATEDREIRTAAYSYCFTRLFNTTKNQYTRFICLRYGVSRTTDPQIELAAPRSVMTSLAKAHFSAKPESEATCSASGNHIVDKSTGKDGIIFYTGAIWPVAVDTVKIEVGWYEGLLSASGNILTLKRINGRWVVIKNELCWIS